MRVFVGEGEEVRSGNNNCISTSIIFIVDDGDDDDGTDNRKERKQRRIRTTITTIMTAIRNVSMATQRQPHRGGDVTPGCHGSVIRVCPPIFLKRLHVLTIASMISGSFSSSFASRQHRTTRPSDRPKRTTFNNTVNTINNLTTIIQRSTST